MGCYIYNCASRNDGEWGLNPRVKNLLAEKVKKMLIASVDPTLVHVRYRLSPTTSFAVDFADWYKYQRNRRAFQPAGNLSIWQCGINARSASEHFFILSAM